VAAVSAVGRKIFKWRIAEVPSDDGSLSSNYVNMWEWYLFVFYFAINLPSIVSRNIKENAH